MRLIVGIGSLFVFVLFSYSFHAGAQSSALINTTSGTIDFSLKKVWENMFVNYENLMGVSAAKEDESEFEGKIDYDEALSGGIINALEMGYKINEDAKASLVGTWNVRPGAEEGEGFEALDPYTKISFADVIESGNFELSSDLRIGHPVSRESQESKKVVTLGSEHEIEYQFGKSDFKFEMEIYFQYNIHSSDENFSDLELRYEPAIIYSFSDTSYSRVSYESQMRHERHDDLTLIDNREATLQSGVGWFLLNRKLNFYPFVDLNLKEPGTKTALYGAQIAWAIH